MVYQKVIYYLRNNQKLEEKIFIKNLSTINDNLIDICIIGVLPGNIILILRFTSNLIGKQKTTYTLGL